MGLALTLALALAAAPTPQQLFDAGDFEVALAKLDAHVATAPPAERAADHLLRARCLLALRRNAEIETALELALQSDPTVRINEDASPGFRATLDRVRARLAGTVEIDTNPTGAAVHIDGALVGRAPVQQLLPVGRYHVSALGSSGEEIAAHELTVAPRSTQRVVLDLGAPRADATATNDTAKPPSAPPVDTTKSSPPAAAKRGGPWPVEPAVVLRGNIDPSAGASIEAGAAVLGRYWLAEVDAVIGGGAGMGLRLGGRLPLAGGLFGLQLTVDGVGFFNGGFAPGIGGTLSLLWHPLSFLDVLVDGGGRYVAAAPGFRSTYGLLGLTLRARWPTGLDD